MCMWGPASYNDCSLKSQQLWFVVWLWSTTRTVFMWSMLTLKHSVFPRIQWRPKECNITYVVQQDTQLSLWLNIHSQYVWQLDVFRTYRSILRSIYRLCAAGLVCVVDWIVGWILTETTRNFFKRMGGWFITT
jgi:hypothetical protein